MVAEYSALLEACLELWAWDELPATKVQKIMAAAKKDGLGGPHIPQGIREEVDKVASIGDEGRVPGNCNRDLMRVLKLNAVPVFRTYEVLAPYKAENALEYKGMPVIFPHTVLSTLAQHYHAEFTRSFGSPEAIASFWTSTSVDDPKWMQHPVTAMPAYRNRAIPIKIHSDKVVMTKTDSLHVHSWSSIFCTAAKARYEAHTFSTVCASVCAHEGADDDDTLHALVRALSWSLRWCLLGKHPMVDWTNTAWPEGSDEDRVKGTPLAVIDGTEYIMCVLGLTCDLEELCNEYGLSHFNSRDPCFLCQCTGYKGGPRPWTDFRPCADWRSTTIALPADGSAMAKPNHHPIWMIPGLSIFCVLFDILHTVDLGICAHVLGSILDELMRDQTFGNNQDERLETVWGWIRRTYSEDKVGNRLAHLKLSMFMSDNNNFAVLHCKGNEARHLLPVLCKFIQAHHDPTDEHKVHRLVAATSLVMYSAGAR